LVEVVEVFAQPLRHGATAAGGALGGGLPGYNLYQARQGWVALAALEPHFWQRFKEELRLNHAPVDVTLLKSIFITKTAAEWEVWAAARDLPLAAVRDI
jgi:crotonobetainyl-CoA:carnitine CoA-transferase CaiB-like acyl-CoA transferase